MVNEGVEVEIYRYDSPTVKAAVLHNTIDPQFTCEIGDGAGSMTIFNLDPEIVKDPTRIDYLNIVKFRLDGIVRQAWIIQKKSNRDLEGSRADENKELSGAGLRQWLQNAVVKPRNGVQTWSHDNRFFNWTTERGAWYKEADWTNVYDAGLVHVTPDKISFPTDWPDWAAGAHWLWGVAQPGNVTPNNTTTYSRREFTIGSGAGGNYRLYCAGDDTIYAWLDGEQLVTNDSPQGGGGFEQSTKVDISLDEGDHVLAFSTENLYGGPAGTLAALCQLINNADGSVGEIPVWVSDTNTAWKCLYNPATVPGWSAGEIFLKLFNEAKDRGVANFNVMVPTWTIDHDSEGNAWTDTLDWSFEIGTTYYDVMKKLEELVCNITIDPDTYEVNMVPSIGTDRTQYEYDIDGVTVLKSPVIFQKGRNLLTAETEGTAKLTNSLMIKTDSGWLESDVTDDSSLTKYGKMESTLNTGASPDVSNELAQVIFKHKADPEEGATYDFVPVEGATPFIDFGVGDWVLAPKEENERVPRQVMSISATRGNAGKINYTVEFDTIFQSDDVRINNILNKTGNGGVGGGFSNNAGGSSTPIGPVTPPPSQGTIRVPKPPTGLSATSVGKWSADGVTPSSDVTLSWTPTSQNTDGTTAIPRFYEVWAHPTSIGASAYQQYAIVTSPSAVIELTPGISWTFKVRTLTDSSKPSDFSAEYVYTTNSPTTAMDAPSTPTVSSEKGLLTVTWNGKLGVNDPPPQFRFVYAQVSIHGANSWSRLGSVLQRGGGTINISNLAIGTQYDVRLIAVDGVGIASNASSIASTTITGIDMGDLNQQVTDAIDAAQTAADNAQTAADNAASAAATAQTSANTAQTTADDANDAASAAQTAANTAQTAADNAQSTANTAKTNAATAQSAADAAQTDADNAATAAANAAGIANGKADVLIQSTIPSSTMQKATTLWIDTTGGANTPKRWNGTSWAVVTDKAATDAAAAAASAASAAATAQSTANTAKTNAATAQTAANAAQASADAANANAISRGTDLVTNGTGYLKNNTNFSSTVFDSDAPIGAIGSFRIVADSTSVFSDTAFPVDTVRHYLLRCWVKAKNAVTGSHFYVGLVPLDAYGNAVDPRNYQYIAATETTLATQLKPGDTTVTLTSATGWNSAPNNYFYVAFWNYTDPGGHVWPQHTYTRNYAQYTGAVSGNTITLSAPWAGPTIAAGTPMAQVLPGGQYMYVAASNGTATNSWVMWQGQVFPGVQDGTKGAAVNHFPPGTAQAKILILANRDVAGAQQMFAAISFSDTTAAQVTADGKNTITRSTSAASGTGAMGDQWWQFSGTQVIGMWLNDGTTWQKQTLTSSVISNLDAGVITAGYLNAARIQAGTITGDKLTAGTITGDKIAGNTVTANNLAADSVTANQIAAGSVTALAMAAGSIQAGAVTAGKIAVGAVTADTIAGYSITGDKIVAGSIEATSLAPSVGNNLDISANSSINIIAGNISDVQGDLQDTQQNLTEMQTYYTFGVDGAIVSKPGSPFSLALRADRIEMLENGNVVSYWTSGQMYVNDFIGTKVVLGNHQIEQYSNGTVVRALS